MEPRNPSINDLVVGNNKHLIGQIHVIEDGCAYVVWSTSLQDLADTIESLGTEIQGMPVKLTDLEWEEQHERWRIL